MGLLGGGEGGKNYGLWVGQGNRECVIELAAGKPSGV